MSVRGGTSLLIYVAGPLANKDSMRKLANIEHAMDIGYRLRLKGHVPIIPHLSHYFDAYLHRTYGQREDAEFYMQWDFDLLRHCDALYFIGPSPGADREISLAGELGLEIFMSMDQVREVPDARRFTHTEGILA